MKAFVVVLFLVASTNSDPICVEVQDIPLTGNQTSDRLLKEALVDLIEKDHKMKAYKVFLTGNNLTICME